MMKNVLKYRDWFKWSRHGMIVNIEQQVEIYHLLVEYIIKQLLNEVE